MVYIKKSSIDTGGGMYLSVNSLVEINTIITGSNNITLRKLNVKPYVFEKLYMDKESIEYNLYKIID